MHREQQLAEIERNRIAAVAHLTSQLERAVDEAQKAELAAELEQTWDHEERYRGIAEAQFRDCMTFIKTKS